MKYHLSSKMTQANVLGSNPLYKTFPNQAHTTLPPAAHLRMSPSGSDNLKGAGQSLPGLGEPGHLLRAAAGAPPWLGATQASSSTPGGGWRSWPPSASSSPCERPLKTHSRCECERKARRSYNRHKALTSEEWAIKTICKDVLYISVYLKVCLWVLETKINTSALFQTGPDSIFRIPSGTRAQHRSAGGKSLEWCQKRTCPCPLWSSQWTRPRSS